MPDLTIAKTKHAIYMIYRYLLVFEHVLCYELLP